jgi:ribosomal protein L35AE/L33A
MPITKYLHVKRVIQISTSIVKIASINSKHESASSLALSMVCWMLVQSELDLVHVVDCSDYPDLGNYLKRDGAW